MSLKLCDWHRRQYNALRHWTTHWTKHDRRRWRADIHRMCLECQGRPAPPQHLGRDLP